MNSWNVKGRVSAKVSTAVDGLTVRIVDHSVGAVVEMASAITDEDGGYQASFPDTAVEELGKVLPDLQAQVFLGETLVGQSRTRYNAPQSVTLHVEIADDDARLLKSEHDTLNAAVARHYTGALGELQETDERPDITYLANKTGWDARAVAMTSLAAQLSEETGLAAPLLYAMFRAGIAADEASMYRISPSKVRALWADATAKGIIPPLSSRDLDTATAQFEALAAQRSLNLPASVGLSSLKELLEISGTSPENQAQFATLYVRHRDDTTRLWEEVTIALGEAAASRLRLDGKLAYLTLNNAPLILKVHAAAGGTLADVRALVDLGFHKFETWQTAIGTDEIPPEIDGRTDEERRQGYADMLAAQVRLSFPTRVVAQMVKDGDTPVGQGAATAVHQFLIDHDGAFEIGKQPLEQYLSRNSLEIEPAVRDEITRIQRVYQITPGDTAMNALLEEGIDSARAVTRYDRAEFVRVFGDRVGGEITARRIHNRAQQVHNAVLNVITSFVTAARAPAIGVHSPPKFIDPPPGPNPNATDVIAYPTLEDLVGAMDFCACEHCRSILSPAAYLVDLLLFCDRQDIESQNPLTVLLERRPDLQHLPLTCENTHTPLPYIDVVNETLEYYVTNGLSLAGYTGHSIDGAVTPQELLAMPQFVSEAAYTTLAGKPLSPNDPVPLLPPAPPLPFHQPLEKLRRYMATLDVRLPEVMEALRQGDNIERPAPADPDHPVEYGWRDILMEELGLSRPEHQRLTDRTLSLQTLFGFDATTTETEVVATLSNAKQLARRLGISYVELDAVLRTSFVNPSVWLLPRLERLGLSFATIKHVKDGVISASELEDLLAPQLDPAAYGGDVHAWLTNQQNYDAIMGLITLTPAEGADPCSFDDLELRYANPDMTANAVRPFELWRIYRFIRLWKKLGWSIEQTDGAIAALYPPEHKPDDPDDAVNLERLDNGFLILLPRLGGIKRMAAALELNVDDDLSAQLSCFANIDRSLYRQMFLGGAKLEDDPAFADDGYGNVLPGTELLLAHTPALRAAFALSADELDAIVDALGFDDTTPLTLENLSAVFRRGWLAKKLRVGVGTLLALLERTGIEAFVPLDPPAPPMQQLVDFKRRLDELALDVEDALFLIWNDDPSGAKTPTPEAITTFARTLRADLEVIAREFDIAQPSNAEAASAKMALVYGSEVADRFFGLLDRSVVTDIAYTHGAATLEQPILDAAGGNLTYDDLRKRLAYTAGVMPEATRVALVSVSGASQAFVDAVNALAAETRTFFMRFPELQAIHDAFIATPDYAALLEAMLPQLEARRRRDHTLLALSAALEIDLELAAALADRADVLHAENDATRPAASDLQAISMGGLSATWHFAATATGPIGASEEATGAVAYGPGEKPLPAHQTPSVSAVFRGYLEAPENGFFNLRVSTDLGAVVSLTLDGQPISLLQDGEVWRNAEPIALRAGSLSAIALTVENVTTALALHWESAGRGWEVIPAARLYSEALTQRLWRAHGRVQKAASLGKALNLSASEIAYLAAHPDYSIASEAWLNALPVLEQPDPTTAHSLFAAASGMLAYARIKDTLDASDSQLLGVLIDPVAATASADGLLPSLTGWSLASVDALLLRFGHAVNGVADRTALADLSTFARVLDAYTQLDALGISADALIAATTNEPHALLVRNFLGALRARFAPRDWLDTIKPINDELRGLSRDALVAYILHQMSLDESSDHIDTPEKLFEYFLMDVQMQPCMQTSRIRHALSSVQLFIERCLMNLETDVSPSAIKRGKQWEWMRRYRVWEANRKVFLFPENWLEPELRDDKSMFFTETMNELLQSDITEDAAASAFIRYLSKLEEVANLEPCGIHYAEAGEDDQRNDVAHIVARTPGVGHKYFYRRFDQVSWSPWEPITLDIEDAPVLPVVWKDRLFLFWLRVLKQGEMKTPTFDDETTDVSALSPSKTIAAASKVNINVILCYSEYRDGKWQPAKTSDPHNPATLDSVAPGAFDRSRIQMKVIVAEDALSIGVAYGGGEWKPFTLYNTHSAPAQEHVSAGSDFPWAAREVITDGTGDQDKLTVTYESQGYGENKVSWTRPALKTTAKDEAVAPQHPLEAPWTAPFFYADSRHAFYVTTEQRWVSVPESDGFELAAIPDLTGLVEALGELAPKADPIGPVIRSDVGDSDSVMQRFVTEDAYIERALATTDTVLFNGTAIGVRGKYETEV